MSAAKTCSACRVKKAITEFGADKSKIDGRRAQCKACRAMLRPDQGGPGSAPAPKAVEEQLPPVTEHRLRVRNAQLEARVKSLLADLDDSQTMSDLHREALATEAPAIKPREMTTNKIREAAALVLASDWHIEEQVRPEQVAYRNRYNLEISERRMTRFFEAVRYSIQFNRQIFKIRDLVLWLGGDIITNYLHPDNVESNLLAPVEAIAYAHTSLKTGIEFLLGDPELERIVIPCNDGNHGRLTKKVQSATRVENSIEWLLYTMLAADFKHEPRVQFSIAQGTQLFLEVYGRTIRFTHGDSVKYGGGVGGVTIPIYKALGRWDTVRRADLTCMGHFHQLTSLTDLIINGSLIGYNTYAMDIGARFEPPAQAFTILDPQRFKSVSMPLWVSERDDDATTKG